MLNIYTLDIEVNFSLASSFLDIQLEQGGAQISGEAVVYVDREVLSVLYKNMFISMVCYGATQHSTEHILNFNIKGEKQHFNQKVYLFKICQFEMSLSFILPEENTIPGRPFLMLIPPDHDQIIEILPGTKS